MQWPEEARRDAGGLESLSDFISLPRDEEGRPIIPTPRATALIEAKEAWATELGTLDAVPVRSHGGSSLRYASRRCRSNGAAQPPVVGEGRGRQAGAGPVIASDWSQASWSMRRGTIACLFCCSRAVPSPRAPLRSMGP